MPLRTSSFFIVLGLIAIATSRALAQDASPCECPDLGTETLHAPDTVFHVVEGFDVAYCGKIDRSVTPFVYSEFTLRFCGPSPGSPTRTPARACHIAVSKPYLVVDEFGLLPSGPDMHLESRPCWRTYHVLRISEYEPQYAINAIPELIATFQEPTPEQVKQVQGRLDGMKPSVHWTDQELLGQVFLCALFDAKWAARFRELREAYLWGGSNAELYDEFLRIIHAKRK